MGCLWGSLSRSVTGPTCVLLCGHRNAVNDQKVFAASLAFLPRHENVVKENGGADSCFLFAVRTDHVISSVSHSAPNAKEPSRRSGTAARLRGLAVRRAQGSILRVPGRRHHGRQVRSTGTIDVGGLQYRSGSGVRRTSQAGFYYVLLLFAIIFACAKILNFGSFSFV